MMNSVKNAQLSSYRERHQQKMKATTTSLGANKASAIQPETVQQVGVGPPQQKQQSRLRSANSREGKVNGGGQDQEQEAQSAWEAAAARARSNRAPSHPPAMARQKSTNQQSQGTLNKRTSATATSGFGAKAKVDTGRVGISMLNNKEQARTGMPSGINRAATGNHQKRHPLIQSLSVNRGEFQPKQRQSLDQFKNIKAKLNMGKTLSGDFSSPGQSKHSGGARQTILSGGANGTGLWVHQSASQSKFDNGNNLPPINKSGGSVKGTPGTSSRPPKHLITASVELQAERGVVQMLEKKLQEAMQESDAAQIRCEKAVFESDIVKKERLDLQNQRVYD